jgi:hypothetical protein
MCDFLDVAEFVLDFLDTLDFVDTRSGDDEPQPTITRRSWWPPETGASGPDP